MTSDFRDAASRHYEDAELLLLPVNGRIANADHLFGIAAECSLKAVMEGLGMMLDDGKPKASGHRVHADKLWAAFQSFAKGRVQARYVVPLAIGNPFANWEIDQRYSSRASFAKPHVDAHHAAATQCLTSLNESLLDGMLS